MLDGGLLAEGKAAYDHGKSKVIDPLGSCEQTIHISPLLDGTNSNGDEDNADLRDSRWQARTNVVRFYNAVREEPLHGIYRYYIAGVDTIFRKLGELEYSSAGEAFAHGHGWRCVWGYTRVLNPIHRATHGPGGESLIDDDEARRLCHSTADGYRGFSNLSDMTYRELVGIQRDRQRDCQRNKMVKQVRINVFGLPRGAACACSLIGKLMRDRASSGKIAGTIPYQINLMGLFDTVTSVGPPDPMRAASDFDTFDGHFTQSSDGLMNIPRDIKRRAHFLSIHEQCMSFPLDIITEGQAYPGGAGQRLEVAYPGVHSDVGGGYPSGDQGKACADDADKLSQIPLHHMHIEALRQGVPPMLEDDIVRSQGEQHDFVLSSSVVNAFNAWLDKMGEISTMTDTMRIGMRQNLVWRTLRACWNTGDYLTNRPFFKIASEDSSTPYQLELQVDKAVKTDVETLKLRQRIKELVAGSAIVGLGNVSQGYTSATKRAAQMEQAVERDKKMQAAWDAMVRRREQLCQEAARKEDKTRPGEGADKTVTNDQHDLRGSAEGFRLPFSYLHPERQAELGVEKLPSSLMVKMERSGLDPVGIGAAAYDAYKDTAQLSYVRRDRNPDSGRVKLVDKDMHVRTDPVVAGVFKAKAFLPERYDMLVLPVREMAERLREWIAPKAVEQLERQNRAIIALFDDYIHDSRAWSRMPYFREYLPGGYGWARVFLVGSDNAVRYLGLAEGTRAAEQAERVKAFVRRINAGPTPTLDEMLMGD